MCVSSTSLNNPPSPRWYVRVTRSEITRARVPWRLCVAFVATTVTGQLPYGDAAVVFTVRTEEKPGLPLGGDTVQGVLAGQPVTLNETGSVERPTTATAEVSDSLRSM